MKQTTYKHHWIWLWLSLGCLAPWSAYGLDDQPAPRGAPAQTATTQPAPAQAPGPRAATTKAQPASQPTSRPVQAAKKPPSSAATQAAPPTKQSPLRAPPRPTTTKVPAKQAPSSAATPGTTTIAPPARLREAAPKTRTPEIKSGPTLRPLLRTPGLVTPHKRPRIRLKPQKDETWWRLSYLIDWGIALGFAGAGAGLYFLEPPIRPFQPGDPAISLKNKPDTISEGLLAGIATGAPLLVFALAQIWVRSGHDFHHAALGLAEAMSLTFFSTILLKVTVGRLRPDFIDRCKPNADLLCQGDAAEVSKGRKSFPSGHSSFAFAGGTFLALYLWGKLKPFDGQGAFWKIPVILLPVAGATLVAITRITDNRHHWEDVLVGALIGTAFGFLGYHLNFPAPWSDQSQKPRKRSHIAIAPILTSEQIGMAFQGSF